MSRRFGWCLDGRHQLCRVYVETPTHSDTTAQIVCSCPCHDTSEGVEAHD